MKLHLDNPNLQLVTWQGKTHAREIGLPKGVTKYDLSRYTFCDLLLPEDTQPLRDRSVEHGDLCLRCMTVLQFFSGVRKE